MEELRLSSRLFSTDLFRYVIGKHGIQWRPSVTSDTQVSSSQIVSSSPFSPPSVSSGVQSHQTVSSRSSPLFQVVTIQVIRIGTSLDQLREVVFTGDGPVLNVTILKTLINAMFHHRPNGYSQVVVACAILAQLAVFCCRTGRPTLVEELVEVLSDLLVERVGRLLKALERFAMVRIDAIKIPAAA